MLILCINCYQHSIITLYFKRNCWNL